MPQMVAEARKEVDPAMALRRMADHRRGPVSSSRFIRHQHLISVDHPNKGVRTVTRAGIGPSMVSDHVSYRHRRR